jgi:uncharacterized RDD family membrane protein YckC
MATLPAPIAPQAQAAGFWIRALAYLVDAFLLSLVGGAFPYLVIPAQNAGQQTQNAGGGSTLLAFLYFVFFWSYLGGGRTLGMRLCGLRVIQEDGKPLGLLAAVVRFIGLVISFLVCFLGVLWVAFDARKQGWHDKLARTVVLRV